MPTQLTLDEFAKQMQQLRAMNGGTPFPADFFRDSPEETLARIDRILAAVRPEKRTETKPIGPSERARIAAESGVPVTEVDRFFVGFERLQARMRELEEMGLVRRLGVIFGGVTLAALLPWLLVVGLVVAPPGRLVRLSVRPTSWW